MDTPLYVTTGFSTSAMRSEWLWGIAAHLIYGVPVTLFLFFSLFAVLLRTQRLYAEINRRAAAEEALRQSQKLDAIGHLTGGVAHDFNNLLTIIIGNLEAAQRQLESWTDGAQIKLSRRLENAMHGAQRAATLTKRLLAFSRQQPLNPALLDVNRVLNGLSDFLRRALGEDVSLEIVGGGGVWPVEADAAELEAAILNLAVNARDAMPDGGKLTIEASNSYLDDDLLPAEGRRAARPIRADRRDRYRLGHGQGRDRPRLRAVLHDQRIRPGHRTWAQPGLRLRQAIGRTRQNLQRSGRRHDDQNLFAAILRQSVGGRREQPHRAAVGRESVLVVEDDSDVRDYVVETLASLGYKVFEAGEAEDALRLLDENPSVHLLLTDVVMPGMNGRKLAEEARLRRPDLKVLYMTGYSRNAIMHQGRLDKGVDLLQKPISSEQLASAVRKMLDA